MQKNKKRIFNSKTVSKKIKFSASLLLALIMVFSNVPFASANIPNTVTVTFALNGGEIFGDSDDVEIIIFTGRSVIPPLDEPTRTGFVFDGWVNENGVTMEEFTYLTITNPRTYTAKWHRLGAFIDPAGMNVTSADAVWLARNIVAGYFDADDISSPTANERTMRIADINGDGEVSAEDVTALFRWLVGYDLEDMREQPQPPAEYYFPRDAEVWHPGEWSDDVANKPIEFPIKRGDIEGAALDEPVKFPDEWIEILEEDFIEQEKLEAVKYIFEALVYFDEDTQNDICSFYSASIPPINLTPYLSFIEMPVESNITWSVTVSNNATEWISVEIVRAFPQYTSGLFYISVDANLGTTQRTGTVTVRFQNGQTSDIVINQPPGFGLVLSTETWEPLFSGAGGVFIICSDRQWSESMSPWLELNSFSPLSRTGNGEIRVEARPNFGNNIRNGFIEVRTMSGSPATTRTVAVTQGTGSVLISPVGSLPMPEHAVTTQPFNVQSSRSWTATSSDTSWLTVTRTIHSGNQTDTGLFNGSFTISTTSPNISTQPRIGRIRVSADGAPNRDITVTQAPGNGLVLSGNEWLVSSANAAYARVNVYSNTAWTARVRNNNDRWLTVTPASGIDDDILRIEVNFNYGIERTAFIDVTAGSVTRTVRVTQPAGSVLWLSGTLGLPCPAASIGYVEVESNRTWDIIVEPPNARDWLRVEQIDPPNRTGHGSFAITTTEHFGPNERYGTIRLTTRSTDVQTEIVEIFQAGRTHNLSLSQNEWNPPSNISHIDVTVTSDANWVAHAPNSWLFVETLHDGTLRIRAEQNTGPTRNGEIIVNAPGAPSRKIDVTQEGRSTFSLSMTTWTPTSAESKATVEITTNNSFQNVNIFNHNPELLEVGNLHIPTRSFEIRVRENTTGTIRSGRITVSDGTGSITIHVTQTLELPLSERLLWNEEPNHRILLRPAVESAGGSVSWDVFTGTMTVNVYDTTVSFQLSDNGVTYVPGRGVAVRADVFYNAIVNAVGQIAFLGVHEVMAGQYHASVLVFARQGNNLLTSYSDHFIPINVFHGIRYATMGAGASHANFTGYVLADFNRPQDRILGIKNEMIFLSASNPSRYGLLFTGTQNFMDYRHSLFGGINYVLFSTLPGTGNSNSFANGLIRYAGFAPVTPKSNVPGWNNPIPLRYFERM